MKIGLALGCGGARALSHIGVIKILEEYGINIDILAGTSMAAIIGSHYAATRDIDSIEEQALHSDWKKLMSVCTDFSFRHSFFRGTKLKRLIRENVKNLDFKQLQIPFAAVATNIHNGQTVVLNEGKVADAVYASCAIPGIFQPVRLNGMTLVDGGVSCPIPVSAVKQMGADVVIAVDAIPQYTPLNKGQTPNVFNILNHTITILNYHVSRYEVKNADAVIYPDCVSVSWTHLLSSEKVADVIKIGEEAALRALPFITRAIENKQNTLHKFFEYIVPKFSPKEKTADVAEILYNNS